MSRVQKASLGLSAGLLLGLLPWLALAASPTVSARADKIDPRVTDQIAVAGRANFWIRLAPQADLDAAYDMDWQTRGRYVYETLSEMAQTTQAPLIAYLEARGLAFDSFWIDNSIWVQGGSLAVVQDLAARREVAYIKADELLYLPELLLDKTPGVQGAADDWGLAWVHAPQVWALGYDGTGIVVATIDTGVQYNHPQLDETYRGAIDGTDQFNWCDPSNICPGDVPCDNHHHGTHVMGTLSGENDDPLSDPNVIGMAPGSNWISCKGCEGDTCSELALTQCAQWIAAPSEVTSGPCGTTGTHDPDKRPHIVNNSWGDTLSNPWYRPLVQTWRALGIFPAFSAGNENLCGSLGSPGDYPESFSSANMLSSGLINPYFSSRGPSNFGAEPYCKPNIAAPGTGIASSVPPDLYGYLTGTSMASPHSAGAAALLWQACPALIGQIDLTFQALQNNAAPAPPDPCAGTPGCADLGCNCTYGYGVLDVYAAAMSCLANTEIGHVDGYVYDRYSRAPIGGASVTAAPALSGEGSIRAISAPNGYYTMTLGAGIYDLTAANTGYVPQTARGLVVVSHLTTHEDFQLPLVGYSAYLPTVLRNR